ncbi:TOBE domain-containing protein [Burkholderia stagnalis]|uniref:Molybdenum-dependent transcriptional regulator n=1 Tax=Burkholderia stagnalis TaxID=1503054 RepID=A0A107ZZA4_9BURK|nr:TOBE domain-containing protein [Burkholderia stagnalis]KVZ02461.1 molybdenum-dependent transcriptional regulator [Burkholderia stagnalis]KWA53573.1 molybdenum-dependent transcriptional regulator [Burkholderia stagnalis]KWA58688.1 molybdenum-dependent transcriptional regulator [Burkholderia stagnalis]KWA60576.1 molybdenum-dependent transcriptional regulator [Burkholderia stagnalis]KWC97450.1 molybdenum-dependent transcriptional regulator [Burkholderia stagnalis]
MSTDPQSPPFTEPLELGGELWLRAGAQTLGGTARIALLAAIGETGSITRAAKAVGISYKAAWDAIDTMNNLAGEPLVQRAAGGKGGGGTALTQRATSLIAAFRTIEREHRRFIESASAAVAGFDVDWALIGRIGMKTSARNQLFGKVASIRRGAVNDEVALALPGGQTIVAVLTHESTEALGLQVGADACALVKASWVMLAVDDGAPAVKVSARNQLHGAVETVKGGAVNGEVTLALDGGGTLTAVVTNDSVDALGLVAGQRAIALFKASSVILAVTA